MTRLEKKYQELRQELMKELGLTNINAVPRLEKIVLNMGIGSILGDSKEIKSAADELTLIAGQKAVPTRAKKAVAGFKLRKGEPVGLKVSLRGDKMYEFLDRLISVALPRTRDFRGLPLKAFAGGSYALGIPEHTVFPEIAIKGLNSRPLGVIIVTDSDDSTKAKLLLQKIGLPFVKEEKKEAVSG